MYSITGLKHSCHPSLFWPDFPEDRLVKIRVKGLIKMALSHAY